MKKISLVGGIRHAVNILIVMQGILFALLTIFFLNQKYLETWKNYTNQNQSITVYLNNVSEDNKGVIENYLYEMAQKENLFITRKDSVLKNSGSFGGYKFGVCGKASATDVGLTFMGIDIIEVSQIEELLSSSNLESTLGIDEGSIYMLHDIPQFRFGHKIVIKKMSQVIAESETICGIYVVNGLPDQIEEFLGGLEEITECSKDDLLTPMSGEMQDDSLAKNILLAILVVQIVLNTITLSVVAIQNLGKQGKLALLGWSKQSFICEIFGSNLMFAMGCIPILVIIGYLMSGWNRISGLIVSFFILSALINMLLSAAEILLSSSVIILTKSIDSIKGRIPKEPLYILGIIIYLILSVCIVFVGSYVDQPIQYIAESARLSKQWEIVSEFEILNKLSVGKDTDSFTGRSNKLNQDIYNWYTDIAEKEGVYLVNTTYYDNGILEQWKQSGYYQVIPDTPFWYFVVSPNYLEELGIHATDEILEKAKKGARVYFLPKSMKETSRAQIIDWIEESTTKNLSSSDIQTEFTKSPEFDYALYEAETDIFTWATTEKYSSTTREPIFYVATPENMRYFETESLRANAFNGYIKFKDEETKELYANDALFAQHNLSDNNILFSRVEKYIDGLQKELWITISWFGLVFLILLIILIGVLLVLSTIFRIANQEKINVKKFLGYNFWQIYRVPIIFLVGVMAFELIAMLILQSKFGLLLVMLIFVLQIVVFMQYMSKNEIRRVLLAFKGD